MRVRSGMRRSADKTEMATPSKTGLLEIVAAGILCLLGAAAAEAQTGTLVTGTFKPPTGQTPQAAGIRSVTIGATAMCGELAFTPYDSAGRRVLRLIFGAQTYFPQPVKAWVRCSDGVLMYLDAVAGTVSAGVRLIPNINSTPTGTVYRLEGKLYDATTSTGTILLPETIYSEQKVVPDQASVDWGTIAPASLTVTSVSYQLTLNASVTGFEDWGGSAAPANPASGTGRVFFNTATGKLECKDSAGANCMAAGSGYQTIQDEGTALTARTTLNFIGAGVSCADNAGSSRTDCTIAGGGGSLTVEEQDGAPSVGSVTTLRFDQADGLVVSTPGAGIARVDLAAIPDGALASNYSGVGACAANQWASTLSDNAAPGCTQPGFSNLSGAATDAQVPNNITIATLDTTFEVQDNLDSTKILQLQLSSIATATTRTWTAPNASGEVTLLGQTIEDPELASNYSGVGACAANQWASTLNDNAAPTCTQPGFSNLSGSATKSKLPAAVAYEDEANIYTVAGAVTLDNQLGVRLREGDAGGDEYIELRAPATIAASLTLTLNVTGQCTGTNGGALSINASNEIVCTDDDGGAGSGDNISVNGVAATNADFDDATPAAPANAVNVKWQKDALDPTNISAHLLLTDVDGAGIGVSGTELVTASSETGFLASGALTCGASAAGRMQVHTTALQYCDNAGTPALQYAAYGNSSGAATTGDAASGFFPDDLPVADGGTGASTAAAARGNLGVHYGLAYGIAAFSPADATTYIIGNQAAPDSTPGDNTKHQIAAPIAGTVKRLCISAYVGGTLGSGESVSFFVRKLGTTDSTESVSVTLNATEVAIACANLTTTFTFAEDDKFSIKMVSPTWVTNPTTVQLRWSIKILQDQ